MMKYIYRSFQMMLLALAVAITGCETTDLDITEDPNALNPSSASTSLFVTSMQQDLGLLISEVEDEASEAVRILQNNDNDYINAFGGPTNFDNQWTNAYQGILQDIRTMNVQARASEEWYHIGIGQVIEAYVITTLYDLFGDVPYSEALQAEAETPILNPGTSDGATIYAAAISLLDSAIANFERTDVVSVPTQDLYYGGDYTKWIKLANSLKMKFYVTTRRVDSNAATAFNAIAGDEDNFISSTADDFEWRWGSSVANPDSRHPRYALHYTPSGVSTGYMSNWMMDYMMNDKVGNSETVFEGRDPRMKYYFYRQAPQISTNPNLIACIIQPPPAHFPAGEVYCTLPDGYWGRDHGNNRGIPPDTQSRTAYGVYPMGGLFDDNSFKTIASISLGGGGAGVTPMMLAAWTDFMRAEMALVAGDAATARTHMESAVTKHMAKVRTFGGLDASANLDTAPSTEDDALYVEEMGLVFAGLSADEQMDMLGSEYFVSLFGNGLDGYNFYRRTGRPSTLQIHFFADPGEFFRTFLYPSTFVNLNSSTEQKTVVTEPPFWGRRCDLVGELDLNYNLNQHEKNCKYIS